MENHHVFMGNPGKPYDFYGRLTVGKSPRRRVVASSEDLMSLRHNNSLSQCPEISPVPGVAGAVAVVGG